VFFIFIHYFVASRSLQYCSFTYKLCCSFKYPLPVDNPDMDDTYETLTVVAVDGTELIFNHIFKEMAVGRFKRAVCMRKRLPADAWEALRLYVNGQEMENDCTLESYTLAAGAIMRAVTSDEVSSRAPSRAGSVVKSITGSTTAATVPPVSSPQQPEMAPPPAYAPEPHPAPPNLPTLFLNDLDGRTVSLNDVPLNLEISDFHTLVGAKTGFDAKYLRILYAGKQFEAGR
jgi:hypothetical protein